MGEIYCLYSTEDGMPRYVGRTENTAARRYKKHITNAMEKSESHLYDWIRDAWRQQFEVEYYVLQTEIIPADLEFYERYWIGQFPKLLNVRDNGEPSSPSEIGNKVIEAIRDLLAHRGSLADASQGPSHEV